MAKLQIIWGQAPLTTVCTFHILSHPTIYSCSKLLQTQTNTMLPQANTMSSDNMMEVPERCCVTGGSDLRDCALLNSTAMHAYCLPCRPSYDG